MSRCRDCSVHRSPVLRTQQRTAARGGQRRPRTARTVARAWTRRSDAGHTRDAARLRPLHVLHFAPPPLLSYCRPRSRVLFCSRSRRALSWLGCRRPESWPCPHPTPFPPCPSGFLPLAPRTPSHSAPLNVHGRMGPPPLVRAQNTRRVDGPTGWRLRAHQGSCFRGTARNPVPTHRHLPLEPSHLPGAARDCVPKMDDHAVAARHDLLSSGLESGSRSACCHSVTLSGRGNNCTGCDRQVRHSCQRINKAATPPPPRPSTMARRSPPPPPPKRRELRSRPEPARDKPPSPRKTRQTKPSTEGLDQDKILELWSQFTADHYEMVEQLPLELHRNSRLLKEMDEESVGALTADDAIT